MAAPLMSLLSPGTIKHVVPWKTRSEFLAVYQGLYSEDEDLQKKAVNRILTWKSRAGSKLSVAIDSSGLLMQACLDHSVAEREDKIQQRETQLRSSYSLALIRFVNHITEKGQTKATAQPVHLIARDFDIPEWIVRLRHDATHSSLPCLDALATGARWALNYLKINFWNQQTQDTSGDGRDMDFHPRRPKMADIRGAMYDFQKVRFQELNSDAEGKNKDTVDHTGALKTLNTYLTQDRLRFVKCLLEDGILISTQDQLDAFGICTEDLLVQSPPTIPLEISEFWRPLLKKMNSASAIPFFLQAAMFSVTSGEGLRNYQLVAWIALILSQCQSYKSRGRKKKKRKQEALFKSTVSVPTKILLSACIQNINKLTAHLLKYLADKESLGGETYNKLMKLLDIHTQMNSGDVSSADSNSDTDTVFTVEDLKRARQKHSNSKGISSNTVHDIQKSIGNDEIPWMVATDIVDWSTIPLGILPTGLVDEEDESDDDEKTKSHKVKGGSSSHSSDDNDDDYKGGRRKSSSKRDSSNDDSDNSENSPSPKRSKLIVTDGTLI